MNPRLRSIPLLRKWSGFLILLWIAAPVCWPRQATAVQAGRLQSPAQNQAADPRVERLLSLAETQYEIVKLLIEQGRFERVLPEMRKIYELNLPIRYDEAVAKSAGLIAHLLVESKQSALAHEVLNEAFPRIRETQNKASLLKIQAYVYKSEGKLEAALETLERALALEKQPVRP